MSKWIAMGLVAVVFGGCASVSKTVTYQTTQWREIEETQLPITIAGSSAMEIREEAQPPKVVVVQSSIPKDFPRARSGRKYLNIGFNPVNPNRALTEEELELILSQDAYVITLDRDHKRSRGWLRAGERVIGIPSSNPDYYRAIWIRRCGNPILNEDRIAIYVRVKRETVPQLSLKTAVQGKARQEVIQVLPVKRWVPETVTKTRELTCQERKTEVSWWRRGLSYVVTGVVGAGGALIGGEIGGVHGVQIGAGIGVLAGRLIGGYTDGSECIDGRDVAEGVVLGVTAGMIAPTTNAPAATAGGHTLPPNGPAGTIYAPPVNPVTGHTLPFN